MELTCRPGENSTQITAERRTLNARTLSSPSGMKLLVNRFQATLIHVRVDLCCRNIRVPQKLLNNSQIGPVRQEMRREGVPQQVRIDIGVKSSARCNFLDDLPNPLGGQLFTVPGKKDFISRLSPNQMNTFLGQILIDRVTGHSPNRHEPGFGAFADDPDDTLLKVQILEARAREFADSQAGRIKQLKYCAISQRKWPDPEVLTSSRRFTCSWLRVSGKNRVSLGNVRSSAGSSSGHRAHLKKTKKDFQRDHNQLHRCRGETSLLLGGQIFGQHDQFDFVGRKGVVFGSQPNPRNLPTIGEWILDNSLIIPAPSRDKE